MSLMFMAGFGAVVERFICEPGAGAARRREKEVLRRRKEGVKDMALRRREAQVARCRI